MINFGEVHLKNGIERIVNGLLGDAPSSFGRKLLSFFASLANWLDWLKRASVLIDNPHVRPTVRRDPKDDPVLATAVAARAKFLVSYDNDFLDLGKPYGVHCIRPREFLAAVLARP